MMGGVPLLMLCNILQGFWKRFVISFLSVIGGSPGMPVQDIAPRCAILRYDYPVMSCTIAMKCDIMMIGLNNRIR